MRKLELYNSTLQRIDELQKTLGVQKEKFLNGQSDYLIRINDRMTKIRNDADTTKNFGERFKAGMCMIFETKNKNSHVVVAEMNELLRRTQTYLNIIHEIEISESKMATLIGQANILKEQSIVQEKASYVNTTSYAKNMTIEQKLNQMIVADNSKTLANLNSDKQKMFMNCLGYVKDLMPQASDEVLNDIAGDLYESIKTMEQEEMMGDAIKAISPMVLNSVAMVLMKNNKEVVDNDNETNMPCYYMDIFENTGWTREYAMNEYVDINGIVDQGMPINQVIIAEISNRIDTLNASYEVAAEYEASMKDEERADLYILNEKDYKRKYDMQLDVTKLKKFISFKENAKTSAMTEAIENVEAREADEELQMA
ncbi:MAG: hypothetical protein MJ246_04970 [Clostridia bacterium]|nr:hypothetical protein [Clostridia bacterium]